MKILSAIALFFIGFLSTAQKAERVSVEGRVTVPEGFGSEGIHIYNKSANLGVASEKEGDFRLKMGVGIPFFQ